jgi:hypothetical protein
MTAALISPTFCATTVIARRHQGQRADPRSSGGQVPGRAEFPARWVGESGTPPYGGGTLYIAWSDGRFSIPQPFEANLPG